MDLLNQILDLFTTFAIIGGGPAGLAAAVSRARRRSAGRPAIGGGGRAGAPAAPRHAYRRPG